MEKGYVLEKIDEVVNSSYKGSIKKQDKKVDDHVIIYSTGNKILDYIIKPITVHVDKDLIIVIASHVFIDKVRKVLR